MSENEPLAQNFNERPPRQPPRKRQHHNKGQPRTPGSGRNKDSPAMTPSQYRDQIAVLSNQLRQAEKKLQQTEQRAEEYKQLAISRGDEVDRLQEDCINVSTQLQQLRAALASPPTPRG
ncbi:hypothetical protein WJX73_008014 [Symbiochloris irregularis]|uniref:Uncharacterized protein n=1 Tax=Symbiochloris irregularis TaxID=706552 RepID=A0AAW1PNK3_9CHLO